MIKVCKPLLVPAYTPSGKTSADPLGWTDELSGGSVLVPVGYDQEYIEYTSNMFYAVSLAASTAYTFHSNATGGAPITLYDASGTQVAAATGDYDEDTGEYLFSDLVYTPGAAGIFVIKFGVNDYMGMGEPYTATISPTPATHSCIVPAHAGSMAGRDTWGYLRTHRDTSTAGVRPIPTTGLLFFAKFATGTAAVGSFTPSGTVSYTTDGGRSAVSLASQYLATSVNVSDLSGDFTFSCWVKPGSSDQFALFAAHDADCRIGLDTISGKWSIWAGNSNWNILEADSGYSSDESSSSGRGSISVTLDKWQHVCWTRSGNVWTLYIDGEVSLRRTRSGTIATGGKISLNRWGNGGEVSGSLLIGKTRIYSVALSAQDIAALAAED